MISEDHISGKLPTFFSKATDNISYPGVDLATF